MRHHLLPSTLRLAALRLALVLASMWMMGACCEGDRCDEDPPGNPPGTECADGACAVATPGCAADAITGTDGEACAVCEGDAGSVEICGATEVARCEVREDFEGDPCRICATDAGEILFDSCFSDVAPEVVACEVTSDPSDPSDPAPPDPSADIVCQTCTNADGAVVNTICEPRHDECREVEDSGRTCRECTRDGVVVIYACELPDIEPRSCEVYANELGRCIDCYDDNDQLLSHSCTLTEDVFVSCTESVTQDGLLCEVCVDANGAQVSRSCGEDERTLSQCALLEYSEQSCVVCVDQFNAPAFTSCERTDCEGDACAPPPDCEFERSPDGALCRTCLAESSGAVEQRCVVETNLACGEIAAADDPNAPNGVCVSCIDTVTEAEVYRRCDGSVSPPTCVTSENAAGELCEICNDPATGEVIYATCAGETCYAIGRYDVPGKTGDTLFLDGAPAVASCSECGVADNFAGIASVQATCTLRDDCGATDLTNPDAICGDTVVFRVAPRACLNPWEVAGYVDQAQQPGYTYELLAILGYALEAGGVGIVSISSGAGPGVDGSCVDSCECGRGDILDVAVRAQDAIATSELFNTVVVRCESDADCGAGTCRIDGACAP